MDPNLFEKDESLWRDQMVELLEKGRLNEIDAVNLKVLLIEMGKSDQRSVRSHLEELICHLLKSIYQPELASLSWYLSIKKQRKALHRIFSDSKNLRNHAESKFNECYKDGREDALDQTGLKKSQIPNTPPFTFEYAMSEELPDSVKKFKTDSSEAD